MPGRTARFRAVIVLIDPTGAEQAFTGLCEGRIGHGQRGIGGFGRGHRRLGVVIATGETVEEARTRARECAAAVKITVE